jgi:predicted ester cyclase
MGNDPATQQRGKDLVWEYWQAMDRAKRLWKSSETSKAWGVWPQSVRSPLQSLHPDAAWHGFLPLRHLHGAAEIWARFWQPLLHAIPDLTRRTYVFLGGRFEGGDWVCGTGDFVGTFARDWLGIPACGTSVHFRFGEFCRVEKDRIVELRILIDLPHLMRQAGIDLLPPSYGRDFWIPGPIAGDGVLIEEKDPTESQKTLDLVEAMIFGGLNRYDQKSQDSQGLEQFWHPQMVWHGPVGIGSAYGLDEFKEKAQGPILRAFPDRKGIGHQARIAEGQFSASTGWPSLVGTHLNDYLGWPPTGRKVGWNIMDFWKREGDLLVENWVMIDLIGAALESGLDLLARLPKTG